MAALLIGWAAPARAVVVSVKGAANAEVRQIRGGAVVEHDTAHESLPGTFANPPVTAQAQVDELDDQGGTVGAAQVAAIYNPPIPGSSGSPNDVGLDLGAFGDETDTSWECSASVTETRNLRTDASELTTSFQAGSPVRLRSHVRVSGALIISGTNATADLTGVHSRMQLSVTLHRGEADPDVRVTGEVVLNGAAGGAVTVQATGAFANMFMPIVDLTGAIPSLPLVKVIVFAGVDLAFDYQVNVGEPYDLELVFGSDAKTIPGGTGAAAVFGLPQAGLQAIFSRVKQDDRGARLAELISQRVDTTGDAYAANASSDGATSMNGVCGLFGADGVGFALSAFALSLGARRRRSRAPAVRETRRAGNR